MREYTKIPQTKTHTLDRNPKAYNQAPTHVILQRYNARNIQRYATDEDDELLQGKFDTAQREENEENSSLNNNFSLLTSNFSLNKTGLPDNLKTGVENLSGFSMDDVRVHYNSNKPAQLQALAYTQGTDIHVAPGQEKHLPHEAWHVVQQKQGRVQPTMQLQDVNVNDNDGLEKEADLMGGRMLENIDNTTIKNNNPSMSNTPILQLTKVYKLEDEDIINDSAKKIEHKEYIKDVLKKEILNEDEKEPMRKFLKGEKLSSSEMPILQSAIKRILDLDDENALKYANRNYFNVVPLVDSNKLDENENLILIGHGYSPGWLASWFFNPTVGNYNPSQLAKKIISKLPEGYNGEIYINGCNTANGVKNYKDGTSFIYRFKQKLNEQKKELGSYTVKGNLGVSTTDTEGIEKIEVTKENKNDIIERLNELIMNAEKAKNAKKQEKYTNIKSKIENNPTTSINGKGAKFII